MCATFIALWCVVFWTRERVLKYTVLVSLALHGLFFIPYNGVIGINRMRAFESPRLVNFTFIRGASNETPPFDIVKDETRKTDSGTTPEMPDKKTGSLASDTVMQETAKKKSAGGEAKGDPDHPDTSNIKWFAFEEHPTGESYSKELNRLINTNLEIPEEILKTGYEGKQAVYFKLSRKGELRAIFIVPKDLSSNPLVNETSISNISRIAPKFPPLPEGVKEDEVWFHVEIDYAK
jgi:hypothetical protein